MSVNTQINTEIRKRTTIDVPEQARGATRRIDLEKEAAESEVARLEQEKMAAELVKAEQEAQERKADKLKQEIENVSER